MEALPTQQQPLTADTELRKMPAHIQFRLSQILLTRWRRLLDVIHVPAAAETVCTSPCDYTQPHQRPLLFSAEHADLIELEAARANRDCLEIVLTEWSSWGTRQTRPRVRHLVDKLRQLGLMGGVNYLLDQLAACDSVTCSETSSQTACTNTVDCTAPHSRNTRQPSAHDAGHASICSQPSDEETEEMRAADSICDWGTHLTSYTYAHLYQITDRFDTTPVSAGGRWLGSGAFGSVYLGISAFSQVAVKRLEASQNGASTQSQALNELRLTSRLSRAHPHLLPLLGYCLRGPHACVVYMYMSEGSLLDHLQAAATGPQSVLPLCWSQRLRIAVQTADALHFLHTAMLQAPGRGAEAEGGAIRRSYVHRDVKSANILLDSAYQARLGDFGLMREICYGEAGGSAEGASGGVHSMSSLLARTQLTDCNMGTQAYMAPEAFRGDISAKTDVFSFGVVLLEICTGLAPYSRDRAGFDLLTHVLECIDVDDSDDVDTRDDKRGSGDNRRTDQRSLMLGLVDRQIVASEGDEDVEQTLGVFRLALKCTQPKRRRPLMKQVLCSLQELT